MGMDTGMGTGMDTGVGICRGVGWSGAVRGGVECGDADEEGIGVRMVRGMTVGEEGGDQDRHRDADEDRCRDGHEDGHEDRPGGMGREAGTR